MTVFSVFSVHPITYYVLTVQQCLVGRVCPLVLKISDELWYRKILIKTAKLNGSISGKLNMTVTLIHDLNKCMHN